MSSLPDHEALTAAARRPQEAREGSDSTGQGGGSSMEAGRVPDHPLSAFRVLSSHLVGPRSFQAGVVLLGASPQVEPVVTKMSESLEARYSLPERRSLSTR